MTIKSSQYAKKGKRNPNRNHSRSGPRFNSQKELRSRSQFIASKKYKFPGSHQIYMGQPNGSIRRIA